MHNYEISCNTWGAMRTQRRVISGLLHSETCRCGLDMRLLPLADIAPKRARAPERVGGIDPGGLGGCLHVGLDVWVDLRWRGCQFSACHACQAILPAVRFLLLVSEQARFRRRPCRGKTASRSHWRRTETDGGRLPPCRITESSDALRGELARLLVVLWSLPPFLMEIRAPCAAHIHTSSRSNVKRSTNPTGFSTGYITNCKVNDRVFLLIRSRRYSFS